jgi:glycosyltransferase involved in cell wall biosynthesis
VQAAEQVAWRQSAGVSQEAPLVLYVGRLVKEKGVRALLEAWKVAGRPGEVLCLAGEGPLRGLDAGARVVYPGHVERAALPAAYASAAAVVVPSLDTRGFREPWGLVCNEAMHQGRAVLATAAVGAAAGGLIRDGDTGLVVPPGDWVQLAAAIRNLLDDPARSARLGENAHAAVAAYDYDAAADAFGRALQAVGVSSAP